MMSLTLLVALALQLGQTAHLALDRQMRRRRRRRRKPISMTTVLPLLKKRTRMATSPRKQQIYLLIRYNTYL